MAFNEPSTSSGSIAVTAGTQIVPNNTNDAQGGAPASGVLVSAQVVAAGAAATMQIYDGTSTSGVLLVSLQAATNATQFANIAQGIAFVNGLFVVVTGTGAKGVLSYTLN